MKIIMKLSQEFTIHGITHTVCITKETELNTVESSVEEICKALADTCGDALHELAKKGKEAIRCSLSNR